jgi:hypothetical protein
VEKQNSTISVSTEMFVGPYPISTETCLPTLFPSSRSTRHGVFHIYIKFDLCFSDSRLANFRRGDVASASSRCWGRRRHPASPG